MVDMEWLMTGSPKVSASVMVEDECASKQNRMAANIQITVDAAVSRRAVALPRWDRTINTGIPTLGTCGKKPRPNVVRVGQRKGVAPLSVSSK